MHGLLCTGRGIHTALERPGPRHRLAGEESDPGRQGCTGSAIQGCIDSGMKGRKAGLHKNSRNIVLFGANGQLGTKLNTLLATKGTVRAVGHAELDLRDLARLRAFIHEKNPALIVNAAAYTAVDAAESDAENAQLVNVEAPRVMAEAARERTALFVHYSNDYVFEGTAHTPYTVESPVSPLGVKGASKLDR